MRTTFNIDMFDGHLIIEVDGQKVLVDTGSPVTFGKPNHLTFMGEEYQCPYSVPGIGSIDTIVEMVKYPVDVLMGLDVIKNYYVLVDYQQQQITFSTEPIEFESAVSAPISTVMGCPCVELAAKGKNVKMAVDTGARISYIDKALTEGENAEETRDDFSPMLGGNFQTPIFSMEASIGETSFPVKFGVLPTLYAAYLQRGGIYGVIGYDLFNAFPVLLDFKNNQLHIGKA